MNCPEELNYALTSFNDNGDITDEVYAAAIEAEETSASDLTVGYELEVTPAIASEVPFLDGYDYSLVGEPGESFANQMVVPKCLDKLRTLGFGSTDVDGIYEIKSPHANHPFSLAATTQGLVSVGLLPKQADYEIPAHLNFGVNRDIGVGTEDHYRVVRLLRVTELLGGSTPFRLTGALRGHDEDAHYFWHGKGLAGVKLGISYEMESMTKTKWVGDSHRIELRSLVYQDSEQFGKAMEVAYFLMHGLFSRDRQVHETFRDFDAWFRNYQKKHALPDLNRANFSPTLFGEARVEKLKYALGKYAKRIERGDSDELAERTSSVIAKISHLTGLPGVVSLNEADASLAA